LTLPLFPYTTLFRSPAPSGEFERTKLQAVKLEGDRAGQPPELGTGLTEAQLLGRVKTAKPGKTVSYFDLQNDSDLLREYLVQQGYLEAIVEPALEGGVATFHVQPGPKPTVAELSCPGATVLSASELEKAAGGVANLVSNPKDAERGIKAAYQERQYLTAEIGPTRVAEEGGQVRIVVPIKEGPAAVVSQVRFEGATRTEEELSRLAAIEPGLPYDANAVSVAVLRLRDLYLRAGHPAVRVVPVLTPSGSDLVLTFKITEGETAVVGPITITGLQRTRQGLVRSQIDLKAGEPLDPRKLSNLERRLLDLGVFSRAVVVAEPGNPAPIKIELEEAAPYKLS